MRRSPVVTILLASLLVLPLVVVTASAESAQFYPTQVTAEGKSIKSLFDITFVIAMFVFVFVEGLIVYILWKFRHNKTVPSGETHRGHTGAEIAWTIVPAVILLGIGTVSAVTLFDIDSVPDAAGSVHVRVIASQFVWQFNYTDGGAKDTINELRVEEGKPVVLDVVSKDVEHQFFVPSFGLKISAVPGRTNHEYFVAPPAGEYHFECTMYCGFGHHEMGAASEATKVVVFAKGSQPLPYGRAPAK